MERESRFTAQDLRRVSEPQWLVIELGVLLDQGVEPDRAVEIAKDLSDRMRWRGETRVPTRTQIRRRVEQARRWNRIETEFDGTNIPELARAHGLGERQVRRIVDAARGKGGGRA